VFFYFFVESDFILCYDVLCDAYVFYVRLLFGGVYENCGYVGCVGGSWVFEFFCLRMR